MLKGEAWVNSTLRRERDIVITAALLPVSGPLIAGGLAATRLIDGKKPLFVQERIGKNGRPFDMYKVRTLPEKTDASPSSVRVTDDDASWLGNLLRMTAIDELPQVINVFRGDMSLVGPRALTAGVIKDMSQVLSRVVFDRWEHIYMSAGPGCFSSNGHALHGGEIGPDTGYERRARLDIEDFEKASPVHDMLLMARIGTTAARVANRGNEL